MSNELRTSFTTGYNLYVLIWDFANNKIWHPTGAAFETWGTGSRSTADYAIALSELASGIGYYIGDWPSGMSAGTYDYVVKYRAGAAAADSDNTISGPIRKYWSGVAVDVEEPETNAVNICNRALGILGGGEDTRTITALGDGSNTSDLCDLFYTPSRKTVLTRLHPQECSYYADLGDESSFTGEKAEWEYVFDLPDECLRVVKQTDEKYHLIEYDFDVKQSKLFTNALSNEDGDSAYIVYVKNETDGSLFSEETARCISLLLASDLAPRIISGDWGWKRRLDLLDEFESLALPIAKGTDKSQKYEHNKHIGRDSHYEVLGGRNEYE